MKKPLLSILLALISILACAETNIVDLLGTWKCISSKDVVEGEIIYDYMKGQLLTVKSDGTYTTTSEEMGRGTYTINGNVFKAQNTKGSRFEATVTLSNGQLTMEGKASYGVEFLYKFEKVSDGGSDDDDDDPNENEFTIDGVTYERVSNNAVRIVDVKKYVTVLTVPESIKRGNRTYVVTSIANYACVNSYVASLTLSEHVTLIGEMALYQCELTNLELGKNLKTIKRAAFALNYQLATLNIGNKVEVIEESAFRECYSLETIIIGSGIHRISIATFGSCFSLKDFYCYAENVPTTYNDTFSNTPISSATLHVPAASIESYKAKSPWKDFGSIVPLTDTDPTPTDITRLSRTQTDNHQLYDLRGCKIAHPQKGIYIQNGKKVMIK